MPDYRMLFEDARGWMYLVTGGLPNWVAECPQAVGLWVLRGSDGRSSWEYVASGRGLSAANYRFSSDQFQMFDLLIWVSGSTSSGYRALPSQPRGKTARELLQDLNNEENRLRDRAREKSRKLRIREMRNAD